VDGLAASGEPAGPAAGRGLAELEAAGNAVAPGLGPLVVRVAVMYEGAAGAVLLDDMERLAVEESRKIGLGRCSWRWTRRRTRRCRCRG
jgi:hypothetical protein